MVGTRQNIALIAVLAVALLLPCGSALAAPPTEPPGKSGDAPGHQKDKQSFRRSAAPGPVEPEAPVATEVVVTAVVTPRVLDRDPGLGGSLGRGADIATASLVQPAPGGFGGIALRPARAPSAGRARIGGCARSSSRTFTLDRAGTSTCSVARSSARSSGRRSRARTRSCCWATCRAARSATGGGARAGATVLRRARLRARRRKGPRGARKPRPSPARRLARAPAARGIAPLGLEQRVPVQSGPLAQLIAGMGRSADRARLPGGLASPRRLRDPRPLPGPPPYGPDLRAPRGRGGRAGAGRVTRDLRRAGFAGRLGLGERRGLRAHPGPRLRLPIRARAGGIGRGAARRSQPLRQGLAGAGRRLRPRRQAPRLVAGHGRPARARWASPTASASGRSGPTSPPARSPGAGWRRSER